MASSLYLHRGARVFGGVEYSPENALAIIIGIPYEETTSYLPGTRFAPDEIRRAAANIEFFSPRAGLDLDTVPIADLGDIAPQHGPEKMIDIVASVVREVAGEHPVDKKLHVYIGGEHTVTAGVVQGLASTVKGGLCILSLDAHFDLRNVYMGARLGHATFMRRLVEKGFKAAFIGVRGFAREEIDYAKRNNLVFIDAPTLLRGTAESAENIIKELLGAGCSHIHVTVDMDVYDPAFAPGVGNPEPEGLTPSIVFDILHAAARLASDNDVTMSIDVVEASPPNDCGAVTSVLAAKTVVEAIAAWLAAKQG